MKILASKDYRLQYPKVLRASEQAKQFIGEKGLVDVIKDVDNLDNLEEYLKAKRAIELNGKGIETGRDLVKDQMLVDSFKEKYQPFADKVKQYTHDLLDYLQETGIKSKEQVESLKRDNPDYVPFNRIFTDEEQEFLNGSFGKPKANASLANQTVIQRIKGSEREVESPFASLIDKTRAAFEQGERNKAAQMVAGYENLPGNPFGLSKVETGKSPADSTISFFRDGIKEEWKINPEQAKAIKNMDANELGILGKILAIPVRVAKVGITGLRPSFILRNIGKDQVSAFINADKGLRGSVLNPKNFFESLVSVLKKDDVYKKIIKEGGSATSFDFWRNPSFENVESIRAGKSLTSKIKYTFTHPSEFLRKMEDLVSKSEELTRIQQGRAAYTGALKEGHTEADAARIGAKAYRENTVDFMRSGNLSKTLNNALMYFNPGIQGSRTLIRSLKTKPVKTTAKIVSSVMLPLAYVTNWNLMDDKRREAYNDIPEWEKENNLVFIPPNPTKDSSGKWNVVKIPFSAEIAQLTKPFRRAQESMYGLDPVKATEIADSLFQTITSLNISSSEGLASTLTPQAIKPTLEVFTNKKFFQDAPVVPDSMKDLAPEAQVFANKTKSGEDRTPTSGTIEALANKLGLSPIKTEFWIKETFGPLSENIVNNVDTIASKLGAISPEKVGGEGFLKSIAASYNKAYGGAVKSEKYTSVEDKIKEFSKIPEGEKRTGAIQEYYNGLSQDDRDIASYKMLMAGLSTKGVKKSDTTIEANKLYQELKAMPISEANKKFSQIKKETPEVASYIRQYAKESKLSQEERDLKGLDVKERAQIIIDKFNSMGSVQEKKTYLFDLKKKGIATDSVIKKIKELLKK